MCLRGNVTSKGTDGECLGIEAKRYPSCCLSKTRLDPATMWNKAHHFGCGAQYVGMRDRAHTPNTAKRQVHFETPEACMENSVTQRKLAARSALSLPPSHGCRTAPEPVLPVSLACAKKPGQRDIAQTSLTQDHNSGVSRE